jgi:flagellar M-ring protein FliF
VDQIKGIFRNTSIAQRIWLAVAVIAVIGGFSMVSKWNAERDFKPLFSNVAAEDGGPILAKLRESAAEYRLEDNGTTILVPSGRVAELRIELASAGLPKSGRIGFELFDKANFGASEFAEQVNYHRAIEGELERSVMSIREVEQARVHITLAKDSLYTESRLSAKASVLIKLRHAAALSPQNIAAICQLTASAVPGLAVDQVSLVDTSGNLLSRPRLASAGDANVETEAALDYRKSVERDLQNKIAATLDPLLGANHFRAGVSAEVDLTSAEQSEETFDPAKSVMLTSQEASDGPSLPSASGIPGTASNLPRPVSKPLSGASNYARHTENVTYQTSRLVKHTRLPQGGVKKLSLSVLVDHDLRWEGTGDKAKRIVEAPSAEKLKVIHDLVAAATGLDTNRGDQLVVEAFPFESTLTAEPITLNLLSSAPVVPPPQQLPLPAWLRTMLEKKPAVVYGAGGGLMLGLIALVVVMRSRSRAAHRKIAAELAAASIEAAKHRPGLSSAHDIERQFEGKLAEAAAENARSQAESLMALNFSSVKTKKTEVLSKHIGSEAKTDPNAVAQVVRTWLRG